jgi:hypothetical protein
MRSLRGGGAGAGARRGSRVGGRRAGARRGAPAWGAAAAAVPASQRARAGGTRRRCTARAAAPAHPPAPYPRVITARHHPTHPHPPPRRSHSVKKQPNARCLGHRPVIKGEAQPYEYQTYGQVGAGVV